MPASHLDTSAHDNSDTAAGNTALLAAATHKLLERSSDEPARVKTRSQTSLSQPQSQDESETPSTSTSTAPLFSALPTPDKVKAAAKAARAAVAEKAGQVRDTVAEEATHLATALPNAVRSEVSRMKESVPRKVQDTLQSTLAAGRAMEERAVKGLQRLSQQAEQVVKDASDAIAQGIENVQTVAAFVETHPDLAQEMTSASVQTFPTEKSRSILLSAQGTASSLVSRTVTKRIDVFPQHQVRRHAASAHRARSLGQHALHSLGLDTWPKVISSGRVGRRLSTAAAQTRRAAQTAIDVSTRVVRQSYGYVHDKVDALKHVNSRMVAQKVQELARVPVGYAKAAADALQVDPEIPRVAVTDDMLAKLAKDQAFEDAQPNPREGWAAVPWTSLGKELIVPAISSSLAFLTVYGGEGLFDSGMQAAVDLTQYFI